MTGSGSVGVVLSPAEVLELLPQREPFRFVDEFIVVDEEHIKARYRFRPEADFYRGHFPGNPVTPGVILLEAIAQYQFASDHARKLDLGRRQVDVRSGNVQVVAHLAGHVRKSGAAGHHVIERAAFALGRKSQMQRGVCLRIQIDQGDRAGRFRQRGSQIDRGGRLTHSAFLIEQRNLMHGIVSTVVPVHTLRPVAEIIRRHGKSA